MSTTWVSRVDPEALGYLPGFLSEDDPRPAREQLDERYAHGGGWNPMPGFRLDPETMLLIYPGDPPLQPLGFTSLRDETIVLFEADFVAIIQKDGSFEAARMD